MILHASHGSARRVKPTDAGAENVANGDNRTSLWRSRTLGDGQTLTLSWDTPQQTEEIRLIFDSDLSCELAITLSSKKQARQLPTPPPSLVRDYVLTLWRDGNRVAEAVVHDSAQRLAIHPAVGVGRSHDPAHRADMGG